MGKGDSPVHTGSDAAVEGGALGSELVAAMVGMTRDRIGELCVGNARRNAGLRHMGQSLAALRDETVGEGDSAIVVAAGPSIKRRDPINVIKASGYKGTVVATESAMYYCLRNGVVPDLTVTVDPFPTRIDRWFGDPNLTEEILAKDDYYRRQDMDENFVDEMRTNREILELLDRHGHEMRIALSTGSSEPVVRRAIDTGMKIFWWNPMLDNSDDPDSLTRDLYRLNGFPCVNAGGNVGTTCWMMADAVLGKQHVALTGVDFAYYDETPYSSTQYYHEAIDLVGEDKLDSVFMRIHNPFTDSWFFTDPAYMWYREAFLELAADAECRTCNCTEGGILFGDNVDFLPLAEFLKDYA
jgi:hypothetical protein